MIKRANNKKKKGFTLIELIIVLAVMAIIALIAIPNFTAVRDNSKVKADKQSCETIERTVLMLVSDESITGNGTIVLTPTKTDLPVADGDIKGSNGRTAKVIVEEALQEVKAPQGKECTGTKTELVDTKAKNPTTYTIVIKDGSVEVVTGAVKAGE
ncbi:type II secretion system protein [Clostridium sp.]|uniref:type II secretion system protein n=1 Tax=Clostridium sp. TaxID=1506 RepID=UPI0032179806